MGNRETERAGNGMAGNEATRPAGSAAGRRTIPIGRHVILPDQHRIIGPEGAVTVEPKIMQVLLCLVDGHGATVPRDVLIGRVWGAAGATDDLVSRAISELRRVFDDDPRRPRVIETIRKRGYRLVVPPPVVAEPAGRVVPPTALGPRLGWTLLGAVLGVALLAVAGARLFRRGAAAGPGPAAHRLVSLTGPEIQPSFSPDGGTIAFAHREPGHRWRGIVLAAADGSGRLRRPAAPAADLGAPAWSPDGATLAAIARTPAGCSLVAWRRSAGRFRTIGPCPAAQAAFLAWLDADSLVVSARTSRMAARRLYVVSAQDGGARVLTSPSERSLGDDGPAPAPDGARIAFIRRRTEGVSDVCLVDRASGVTRCLTRDGRSVYGLAWDADGRGLVFASNRDGRDGIWRLALPDGTVSWVMGTEGPAWNLAIAPDGRRLVFERRSYLADIWRVSLQRPDRRAVRAIGSSAWDAKPRVDPSGSALLFESNRAGTYELWTSTLAGDRATRLTSLGTPYDGSGVWSHDGRRVAFNGRSGGTGDIWIVERRSGETRRLTGPSSDDAVPAWSRDDRWLYFGSDRSGRWEVWKMPADSGPAEQVTLTGGYRALEGADGRTLYYARLDSAGIWRLRPGRPDPERLVADLAVGDFDNWTLRGGTLFYLARGTRPGQVTLRQFRLPAGPSVALMTLDSVPREPGGIDVSPDGASLFVTRVARAESDLLVVDAGLGNPGPSGATTRWRKPGPPGPARDWLASRRTVLVYHPSQD